MEGPRLVDSGTRSLVVVSAHAGEHAAICLDVGYGGIRLSTRDSVEVDNGSRVAACVKLGVSRFEDWFTVADARVTSDGTMLHLRL